MTVRGVEEVGWYLLFVPHFAVGGKSEDEALAAGAGGEVEAHLSVQVTRRYL